MNANEYEWRIKEDRQGSCRNYCNYARYCYAKGKNGIDSYQCADYYHIEDILADARDMREEQMRSYAEEFDVPYEEVEDYI